MITINDTQIHVDYLYKQIKYKSTSIYIKKAVLTTPQYQKELFTLNMFPKNKQNKQTKKDEIQKEC